MTPLNILPSELLILLKFHSLSLPLTTPGTHTIFCLILRATHRVVLELLHGRIVRLDKLLLNL